MVMTVNKKEYMCKYRETHKVQIAEKAKEYKELNKEQIDQYQKEYLEEYRVTHKNQIDSQNKLYRENHKTEIQERDRLYRQTHKKEKAEKDRLYQQSHKEKISAYLKVYNVGYCEKNKDKIKKKNQIWNDTHKEHKSEHGAAYNRKLKVDALTCYGHGKCACVRCGNNDIRVLSIDHINGGGLKHRKAEGIYSLYSWLFKNNYPLGFQTLCMSCQWIKRAEAKEYLFCTPNKRSIQDAKCRLRLKTEVLTHYGHNKCACVKCGCDDIRVLNIDHINGDGAKHRLETNTVGGGSTYRWLKRNSYPSGFQTLCQNCNWIKRYENKEMGNHNKIKSGDKNDGFAGLPRISGTV